MTANLYIAPESPATRKEPAWAKGLRVGDEFSIGLPITLLSIEPAPGQPPVARRIRHLVMVAYFYMMTG